VRGGGSKESNRGWGAEGTAPKSGKKRNHKGKGISAGVILLVKGKSERWNKPLDHVRGAEIVDREKAVGTNQTFLQKPQGK